VCRPYADALEAPYFAVSKETISRGERAALTTLRKDTPSLRAIAYWLFWLWLALVLWVFVGDLANYLVDSETYHRVYRDPHFYRATMWAAAVLSILAVGFQAAGWRRRRVSRAAIVISVVLVGYMVANLTFDIHKTCCG
jgi:cell division protein FtsW (lipid II flippase)